MHIYVNSLTGALPNDLSTVTKLKNLKVYLNFFSGGEPSFPSVTTFEYAPQNSDEYLGLRALYYATNGDSWSNNGNWNIEDNLNTWYGITASAGTTVSEINNDMRDNNLVGTIPPEVSKLTNLQYASFFDNSLSGTLPVAFASIAILTELSFGRNSLTGSISSEVSLYTAMKDLSIRDNSLTGDIPASFGTLTALTLFHVYGNSITGTLPGSISNLVNLRQLWVYSNSLSRCKPSFFLTTLTSYIYYPQFSPERVALEALYDSTNGASWTTSTNWKTSDDINSWHGVTSSCQSAEVTDLRLDGNNLAGTDVQKSS
jgi:hypothetical protein